MNDAPLPPVAQLRQTLADAIASLKQARREAAGTNDEVLDYLVSSSLRIAELALARVKG